MIELRHQWVEHCWRLAQRRADLYSGARKILRTIRLSFTLNNQLTLTDAGYTKSKLSILTGHYLHEESRRVAIDLWRKRCGQQKYGSVSFTTFNHFVKGGSIDAKRSKRASVFGPCIQSVSITWVNKSTVAVDVFYRTTELFKKFAPDLVFLRDVLLPPFKLPGDTQVTFHFANVTIHPMYAVTTFPHLTDPIAVLEKLRKSDKYFYDWVIKWSGRYICPEHHRGIAKFAQAMRVHKDAASRIDAETMLCLQAYIRSHHPGYRNEYVDPDDED